MDKCYTVTEMAYDGNERSITFNLLRVTKELTKAIELVFMFTKIRESDIIEAYHEGHVDVEYYGSIFSIEEHVLE